MMDVADDVINRGELDELAAIIGVDGLAEIVELFVADAPRQLAALEAAAQRGDLPALERAAHAFKGAAGGVAAMRVARLAGQLESDARGGDRARIGELIVGLTRETRQAREALLALIR